MPRSPNASNGSNINTPNALPIKQAGIMGQEIRRAPGNTRNPSLRGSSQRQDSIDATIKASEDTPPALLLARRIKAEQGLEQVSGFLDAMAPFLAPAERLFIARALGMQYDATSSAKDNPSAAAKQTTAQNNGAQNMGMNPMTLLQMMGNGKGAKNGMNPAMMGQFMNMMNGKPNGH